jgi:membrane protein DedA with SNARE-associated domain
MRHESGYINSAPRFFRLILWAALLWTAILLVLAAVLPAPLQPPADPARVPNPVKAGWFLLWLQEVVSWSKYGIYPVLAAGVWLVALPWLGSGAERQRAVWWPRERVASALLLTVLVLAVLLLTVLALWFRGENWALVAPWR